MFDSLVASIVAILAVVIGSLVVGYVFGRWHSLYLDEAWIENAPKEPVRELLEIRHEVVPEAQERSDVWQIYETERAIRANGGRR